MNLNNLILKTSTLLTNFAVYFKITQRYEYNFEMFAYRPHTT